MAHMIDMTTGRPAIAYAGETPWHKLGRKMTDVERRNIAAALKLAGLDWDVERIALQYATTNPDSTIGLQAAKTVPDAFGIVRTDTRAYLGTVGAQFTPIQHREAFDEILTPLVSAFGCTVEVMASLDGGRRQFALVKMPDATVTPAAGDDVRGYFCVANGHDGSQSFRAMLTPIRVVCQNTLSMANADGRTVAAVTIRHTKSAPDRLQQAAQLIHRMQAAMTTTGETFAQLAQRTMNARELAQYIEQVIPAPKVAEGEAPAALSDTIKARREEIARLIFDGKHVADGISNASTGVSTAWRAYNAVAEYFDHVRAREAKSQSARMTAYDSALFGGNALIKANALRQLVAA